MTTDLDHLEKLHREATQGRRDVMHFDERGAGDRRHLIMANGEVVGMYDDENVPSRQARANAEASAASHNAMPALIAELRGKRNDVANLEEMLATLNGQVSEMLAFLGVDTSVETGVPGDTWALRDALIAREAELRALREVAAAAGSLDDELSEHATGCGGEYGIGYRCYCYAETRDHLREALAKVPR